MVRFGGEAAVPPACRISGQKFGLPLIERSPDNAKRVACGIGAGNAGEKNVGETGECGSR